MNISKTQCLLIDQFSRYFNKHQWYYFYNKIFEGTYSQIETRQLFNEKSLFLVYPIIFAFSNTFTSSQNIFHI